VRVVAQTLTTCRDDVAERVAALHAAAEDRAAAFGDDRDRDTEQRDEEIIAGTTLGNTSPIMTRNLLAPWARAAITNSRCDHCREFARVIRPRIGIDTIPSATISHTMRVVNETGTVPPSALV
jgi:hypothetical protein